MKKGKKTILAALCLFSVTSILSPLTASANEDQKENVFYEEVIFQQNTYELEMVEYGQYYEEVIINANLRASGTYSSTYDMRAGITTKQSWKTSSTPTFEVDITPDTYDECPESINPNITVYLQKKSTFGWKEVDSDKVTLKNGGNVTLTGDGEGTYRIYVSNPSKYLTTGDIYIKFSYED